MPRTGWAEQDPEDWRRAAEEALASLAVDDVAGIGLTGQMHGLVALDADERVLRPAILWNDQRTGAECREIEERIGLGRLLELTGNRALPGFTAPKLLWLRSNEPETYERIAHVLLPKDYVRLALTGERATDVADASGTLLFDVPRPPLERRGARRPRAPGGLALPGARVAVVLGRDGGRNPRRGRRRRPGGWGAWRRGRCAGAGLGRPGDLRGRLRRPARADPRPARSGARLLPCGAGHLARNGRDAVCGRGASLVSGRVRAGRGVRPAGRRGRTLAARRGGPPLPALPGGRAHPACGPAGAGRVHRPLAASRPRRPRPRRARGGRLRAPRLARSPPLARLPPRRRPRVRRRRAQRALASDRRLRPRVAARADGGGGRRRATARLCSVASQEACSRTSTRQWRRASACGRRSSPTHSGNRLYSEGYDRYRSLYPVLRPLEVE